MPDEPETTAAEDQTIEPGAEDTAPAYTFPFEIPVDLSTADEDTLRGLHTQVREHAQSLAGSDPADTSEDALAGLRACAALAGEIRDELIGRASAAEEAEARAAEAAELAAALDEELPAPPPAPEPVPAVTASTTRRPAPRAAAVARRSTAAPQVPQTVDRGRASLTASSDFAGYTTGQQLQSFRDAARILAARVEQYPAPPIQGRGRVNMAKRPITVYDPESPGRRLTLAQYQRHQGVQIRRDLPETLRVDQGNIGSAYEVAQFAASERRLPGGSLVESLRQSLRTNPRRGLTAAAGWCAPSDVVYDLVELETLEGIVDAPELQTPRGGWQIPEDGGPDFSSIWSSIGNSGDTHLTEAEVIADTSKQCVEIVCPDFIEKRLDVDYVCLTGSLLQRRGYPEAVARFTRAALIALAHKINAGYINALVDGSQNRILGEDPSGDDAASAILSAVELAAMDIRYRNRMSFNATMEAIFPAWVRGPIRAALSRRTGVALMNVSDAMILEWFTDRGVAPQFVYDWQDNYNGTGLGAATPASAWPTRAKFLVFPAGTWVKAVADVIDLDTIYDSSLLETNQYTALFSETGWQALKMGPTSYQYDVPVDVSGVVACCPDEAVS